MTTDEMMSGAVKAAGTTSLNLPGPVLVTGAGGQLGREIVRVFTATGADVRGFTHEELNIGEREAVEDAVKRVAPALIINAAAWTSVDDAEQNEEACRRVNALGPAFLAASGVPVVHFSTDYVFDGTIRGKSYNERNRAVPLSVYGKTKLEADQLLLSMGKKDGTRGLILRTGWVWSEVPGTKNFFHAIVAQVEAKKPLKVIADQVGAPTRAADLAEAVLALVQKGAHLEPMRLFNAAPQGTCSWFGFAKEIVSLMGGRPEEVTPLTTTQWRAQRENYGKTIAPRPLLSVLSPNLLTRTYGVTLPDWRESLAVGFAKFRAAKAE